MFQLLHKISVVAKTPGRDWGWGVFLFQSFVFQFLLLLFYLFKQAEVLAAIQLMWTCYTHPPRYTQRTVIRELKHTRFWDADGNRKWAVFPLTCLHPTTLTFLCLFSPLEMLDIKIWETPLSWHAQFSLPVAVRVSRTCMLKLTICEC